MSKSIDLMKLGRRIKRLRTIYGLSQEELGKRVGRSKQLISALERGRVAPSFTLLNTLSSALLCSRAKFFEKQQQLSSESAVPEPQTFGIGPQVRLLRIAKTRIVLRRRKKL